MDGNRIVMSPEGTVIDYHESNDSWMAICPDHGVVAVRPGLALDHDVVVYLAARHERDIHGDDGLIPMEMLAHLANEAHEHDKGRK